MWGGATGRIGRVGRVGRVWGDATGRECVACERAVCKGVPPAVNLHFAMSCHFGFWLGCGLPGESDV